MEKPRVRICDIAEELGLSTATVSNVLNGKTGKISDETVRRVMERVEAREYLPGRAGILLAQNDARIIGVFINDHEKYEGHALDDFFIASSLNFLSAEIEGGGRFMMVKRARSAEEIIRFASMWNMEGVVVIGFCAQDYSCLRRRMRIPFVVYDGFCENPERIANLTLDNYDGGRQLGCHLRRLGHGRALCISDNDAGVDHERFRGFCAGFAPGWAELMRVPLRREERQAFYRGQLAALRSVTAIFAVSDAYAIELMSFLQRQGIDVPGEISVAGFDDIPLCRMVTPALTSVRQDGALRARLAMEKLKALKEGRAVEPELRLSVELVVRESTQAAR